MKEDVIVYYITGRQLGPLSVPASWCEECDLTTRAVREVLRELDPGGRLRFATKPWLRHVFKALSKEGWHPPVVLIGDEVFSQGVVPDRDALRQRLAELLEDRAAELATVAR